MSRAKFYSLYCLKRSDNKESLQNKKTTKHACTEETHCEIPIMNVNLKVENSVLFDF